MKKQKYFFHSKAIVSSILTLLLAVIPHLIEGVNTEFSGGLILLIISTVCTSMGSILGRYHAEGEIYTSKGFPGRNYTPVRDL